MSTPSPVPLDDFDPVSPYAPRWARHHTEPAAASDEQDAAKPPRPNGIETDNDARLLDEIEDSLRAMIAATHGSTPVEPPESVRLSDVSRIAAEQAAQHLVERDASHVPGSCAADSHPAVPQSDPRVDEQRRAHPHRIDRTNSELLESVFDPNVPPWLLPRSLEPSPVPEPWPRPRKRFSGNANKLFLRFGLAATSAAVVAAVLIKDVPSLVYETVRGPISELSTNAAAVFNEGKASPLQARMDAVGKEPERAPAAALRYAAGNVGSPDQRANKSDPLSRAGPEPKTAPEARRETVMAPWPSPEGATRSEPVSLQAAASRAPANDGAATPVNPRSLTSEEIAMLRKMGDDYITSGDFVGARAVLERAADAGDASAAFAVAATYDPVVLARFKVRGLEPDIVKAGFWYERARELGSSEAPRRLQAMARGD
jgi:TPR repeat protein